MKYGRPTAKFINDQCDMLADHGLADVAVTFSVVCLWARREHATRVWQAMQALVWAQQLVSTAARHARAEYERGLADGAPGCLVERV